MKLKGKAGQDGRTTPADYDRQRRKRDYHADVMRDSLRDKVPPRSSQKEPRG